MIPLIVFIGKPGVGKSTLIKAAFLGAKVIDVMPFVKQYSENGVVPEEKTIQGYKDMYRSLQEELARSEQVILELGTNHVELNIESLQAIAQIRPVITFLCTASLETCRKRALERNQEFDPDALERRLQRNFPNSYLALLPTTPIQFMLLDMERSLEENVVSVKARIEDS